MFVHGMEELSGRAHEPAIGATPLLGESIGVFSPRLLLPFFLLLGVLPLLQRQRVLKPMASRGQLRGDGTPNPQHRNSQSRPAGDQRCGYLCIHVAPRSDAQVVAHTGQMMTALSTQGGAA